MSGFFRNPFKIKTANSPICGALLTGLLREGSTPECSREPNHEGDHLDAARRTEWAEPTTMPDGARRLSRVRMY
jgi:hypothetical protein